MKGIDLCCCLGAGMRFLARNYGCNICGVDGTETVLNKAVERAKQDGFGNKLELVRLQIEAWHALKDLGYIPVQ
jgi:cyclopropane fatty-acyl-phospholipid synthase-like methyltransferase